MSLYNSLFGCNEYYEILLRCLGFSLKEIPRFRDCFIENNTICIYTRTGGGNREFYDNEKKCKKSYLKYYPEEQYEVRPWNDDLRKNPHYLYDVDDDFDCTYAKFFFKFPEEYKNDLEKLSKGTRKNWKNLCEIINE